MNIGIVVWELNIQGGTQRQALEFSLHLQKMGHNVRVYTAYYAKELCYSDMLDQLEIRYLFLDKQEVIRVRRRPGTMRDDFKGAVIKFFSRVKRRLKTEKICESFTALIDKDLDILCCYDYGVCPVGAQYKAKTGVPVIWQMNDAPIQKVNFKDWLSVMRWVVSPVKGRVLFKPIKFINRHYQSIKTMDRIVVMDDRNRNKLRDDFDIESVLVRNGVDSKKFGFLERDHSGHKWTILSNGIFFPHRRFEDLMEALKIVKKQGVEFQLHHVGTDVRCAWYAERISNMVQDLGLSDDVQFHGDISEEKLVALYSTSDAFVFPNYPQTWGLAVFEAMSCGTPVIVSTGCGASEVLTDGENALLVPPQAPQKIADAIIKLKQAPDLWKKLSMNGRQFVEQHIRWDLYAEQMMRVVNGVFETKKINNRGYTKAACFLS